MQKKKLIVLTGAVLAFGLIAAQGATAQTGGGIDQATLDYKAALESAFGSGYWTGRFETRDAAGQLADADETPSCVAPGQQGEFAQTIIAALDSLRSVGTCSSSGSGAGSLNYSMICTGASGAQFEYISTGAFKPGVSTELHVALGPKGRTKSVHLTMQRASASCPQ